MLPSSLSAAPKVRAPLNGDKGWEVKSLCKTREMKLKMEKDKVLSSESRVLRNHRRELDQGPGRKEPEGKSGVTEDHNMNTMDHR